jgi:PAT family beta-lactamase induction signal transducer AmpG
VLVYGQPRMLSMLALGFSSGLPFMLIYSTLSAWLRQSGIERATIGMLSWVSLVYTLKFLWAPVVDRLSLPVIGRLLGQRRSWMLLAQAGIASALLALSRSDPRVQVVHMAGLALLLAFAAATQDVAIDAWRIESAPVREQGAMAAAYQLGYRLAILVGQAGALWIADDLGWARSYSTMAALVGIGVVTTLLVREPKRIAPLTSVLSEQRVVDWLARRAHWPDSLRHAGAWFLGAVLCPVLDFFARYGATLGIADLRLHRYLSPDRLHHGLDGQSVLPRSGIYAEADRRGGEDLWHRTQRGRHSGRGPGGGPARPHALAGAR